MNAGKSTSLLQSSYNYRERGLNSLVMAPELDNRYGVGKVTSRIGLEAKATIFKPGIDLYKLIHQKHQHKALPTNYFFIITKTLLPNTLKAP